MKAKKIKCSTREKEILELLLESPSTGWEIESVVFCRYAPAAMQRLSMKGIFIVSTAIPYMKQNGDKVKEIKVALYSIHPDSIEDVERILEG